MAEYLSPGVYVEEFDSNPSPMQGVSTSTAGFVGAAEKGPVSGAPMLVTNPADFARKFGSYLQESAFSEYRYLAYAVNSFFSNGGSRAFVMRVAPADAARAKISDPGGTVSFTAKSPGAWGNGISVTLSAAGKAKTQIFEDLGGTYVVKNAADFYPGDVVALEGEDSAEYGVVSAVDGNRVTLRSPFTAAEVVDKKLLPTTVLHTCEMLVEVRCEDTVERYENVSLNIAAANFLCKTMAKSELVDVTAPPSEEAKPPLETLRSLFGSEGDALRLGLEGGADGSASALTDADYIGEDKGPGARTGLQSFLDNSDVSLMAVPGIVSPNVQLSLVAHCEALGSRFAVLDIPRDSLSVADIMAQREVVDSDYCAMYHPWLKVFDPLDKKDIFIPPSGAVLGVYARSDNTRGVHKAPANETVAACTDLMCNYNTGEQDLLNPKGVNLIRRLPGLGIRVWGARTASSKPQWKYINVRRLFIYLEETIKANTGWVVFEPNDELLWIRVKRTIEVFLEGVWRSGALAGSTAAESFFVDIGPSTMSKDDIDNGRLICVIGVAPVKPAEFVIFRLTQKTGE